MKSLTVLLLVFLVAAFVSCDKTQIPVSPTTDEPTVQTVPSDNLPAEAIARIQMLKAERAKAIAIFAQKLAKRGELTPRETAAKITVPGDYDTIQEAVDAALPGDKIIVGDGTYYENVTIMTDRLRLTVAHKNSVYLHGRINVWQTTGVTVEGFHIEAEEWAGIDAYLNSDLTIKDNEVYGCPDMGIWLDGVSSSLVKDNKVHDNYYGIRLGGGCSSVYVKLNTAWDNAFGIYCSHSDNNGFKDNTCTSNDFNGIGIYASAWNHGSDNTCNDNGEAGLDFNEADHNTFKDTEASANAACGVYFSTTADNNTLTDLLACDNDGGAFIDDGTGNTVSLEPCN